MTVEADTERLCGLVLQIIFQLVWLTPVVAAVVALELAQLVEAA